MEVITETLRGSFEECWLAYLQSSYHLFICSQQEIQMKNYDAIISNRELADYFAQRKSLPIEFMPYFILTTDALSLQAENIAPLNTLDFPVLEHLMARIPPNRLGSFRELFRRKQDLHRLEERLDRYFDWDPGEFMYFAETRLGTSSGMGKVLKEVTSASYDEMDARYIQAVQTHAIKLNTSSSYGRAFRKLISRDNCEAASAFIAKIAGSVSRIPNPLQDIGECFYFENQYNEALAVFEQQWQTHQTRETPLFYGRTLIKLNRFNEALTWFERAREFGVDRKSKIDFYTAVAYEGLQDAINATHYYLETLKDPDSSREERSRKALLRLDQASPAGSLP